MMVGWQHSQCKICPLVSAAVKELTLSYYDKETPLLITIPAYSGNLLQVP